MKNFLNWVVAQYTDNFFSMVIYSGAVLVVGWFTGPLVPGVNKVVANLAAKSIAAKNE